MAATVQIHSWHGSAPGSSADKTSGDVRFKVADNDTADTNNPVSIPASSYAYSFIKNMRLNCTVTPDSIIDNLKFYSDGVAWGTGDQIMVRASDTYVDPVSNGATALTGTTDAITYTNAAPLSLTGSISNPNTGALGQYVVMQRRVGSTAAPGTVTGRTYYFRYDEI
jgi:hypothetical protein